VALYSELTFRVRVKADNKEKTVEFVLKPAGSAAKKIKAVLYQPPTPAKDLLAEFWKLEKEAEKMLEGLAK
jgi:hypothetical protein